MFSHSCDTSRCACDIPAHNYTYSFEPKHDWSRKFAGVQEIKTYFNEFSKKYGLQKYIKTCHRVISARWVETTGQWIMGIEDLNLNKITEDSCDVLINAGGYLNHWKWPDVPGLQAYKGTLVHTGNWDDSIDLKGKRVGLIGNESVLYDLQAYLLADLMISSSSAVQVLPAIQPIVGELITFIRSPTWLHSTKQQIFTHEEVDNFARNPKELHALRKANEVWANSVFSKRHFLLSQLLILSGFDACRCIPERLAVTG